MHNLLNTLYVMTPGAYAHLESNTLRIDVAKKMPPRERLSIALVALADEEEFLGRLEALASLRLCRYVEAANEIRGVKYAYAGRSSGAGKNEAKGSTVYGTKDANQENRHHRAFWIPAFAGMTAVPGLRLVPFGSGPNGTARRSRRNRMMRRLAAGPSRGSLDISVAQSYRFVRKLL